MPLPLVAIPLALGAASAAGSIARASSAKKAAEASMPEEYKKRLKQLEQRERDDQLGLTEGQRAAMESQGAAQRAGMVADQQARQLQQAQANSAFTGRDLYMQDLAAQEAQQRAFSEQNRQIMQADIAAEERNQQMMLELQQRQADAEAARKMANRQLVGDLLMGAVTTGATAYGAKQMSDAQRLGLGTEAGRNAAMNAQQTAAFASIYGLGRR
jgi:hypothetical protein